MNALKMDNQSRERRARGRLARHGYGVYKSRIQTPNERNRGGYMIYNVYSNEIAAGENFDCFLDELEAAAATLRPSDGVVMAEKNDHKGNSFFT